MPPSPSPAPAGTTQLKGAAASSPEARTATDEEEVRPYVLSAEIGKGSFATVYRGYHEVTRQVVAVKTVSRSILTPKLVDNLWSEIHILKQLSHKHITQLIDIKERPKYYYLVMEYCSGGDLSLYIKRRGKVEGLSYIPAPGEAPTYYPHPRNGGLAELVVRSFLRQLARAMKFLRHRNLLHRDIKPQNLLLTPADEEDFAKGHPLGVPILKVADFGFARILPNATMAETLCGSPLYMAPEILRYEKYDAKADLWSVGAVLYEMCVGRPPFRAQNHIELLKRIEKARSLVAFPDEDPNFNSNGSDAQPVPADMKKLIRSLLKRHPVERASFDEFFASQALQNSKFPRPEKKPAETTKEQDSILSRIPDNHRIIPPEVLDPKSIVPPSTFNFRRRGTEQNSGSSSNAPGTSEGSRRSSTSPRSSPRSLGVPLHPVTTREKQAAALESDGTVIPGETEEDSAMRREYVIVGDTKAVEFTKTVDEIHSQRTRRLLGDRKPALPPVDDENQEGFASVSGSPASNNITFPPVTNHSISSSPEYPPQYITPSRNTATNALSRALNIASKKLFGTMRSPSDRAIPRRPPLIIKNYYPEEDERDPEEDELLAKLEDLAQKTAVLTKWSDEMYEYVKAIPQKPLSDPTKFSKREGEADRQARKRQTAEVEAEYNAVTCVSLYMLLMSFSQRGIDVLRAYQNKLKAKDPDGNFTVSEGFDDALVWFRDHFIKCNERVTLVKTWLPSEFSRAPKWLDQLIYDHALQLSRTAARKELLGKMSSNDECEKLYEESLWCLYALQDDLMQQENPFQTEDHKLIDTWIKRTKLRLFRCRARMNMNDDERLNDARADQNLDDVMRYPAPWDAKPPSPQRTNEARN
ncbi:other/ULK/ULK protein kinase [Sistotremastrum niveocremeum HHB9708]|uniref:non-specific serine/threonine protein kinase n=1 Tax=Sistotremastrum niveocremeum HHB9708 TaxID=1314777 RepID=A0A164YHG3_9AGAM|nr:other/ULK/ULK protein kinase [Sistotremastrum niveocremeum HHB9708]